MSVADGVLALMSLHVDEYLATGEVPGPGHDLLTGRYACYDVYRCADGRWVAVGAIEPHFCANLCRAARLRAVGRRTRPTTRCRTQIRADFARRVRDAATATSGSPSSARPTRASRRSLTVPELVDDAQFARARRVRRRATHAEHGDFEQVGSVLAGMDRDQPAADACATRPSPTPTRCSRDAGFAADEIAALREEGVVA